MRLAISLGALSGANLLLLVFFQWYVLVALGPGTETDALFAGMAVPQLVLAVVSGSLMHVLVPFLAGENEERFREDSWGIFLIVGAVFGFLSLALYLSASYWVPLLVPGFSQAGKILTVRLTRIQLIGILFTALTGVLWAIYHARQRFLWAEFSPLFGNAIGLGYLFLALPRYGITAAAWAMVLRSFLQLSLLLPGLKRYRTPELGSPSLKEVWSRIKPLLLGSAYYKTDIVVDRFLSSMAPTGSLSLLYLAQQVYNAANQIINKAIAAPMVPLLAEKAKSRSWVRFRDIYRKRLFWMAALTISSFVFFLVAGKQLLKVLIGHGGVTESNVIQLWAILVCLGGVYIGGAIGQILSSSFYAMADTRTPTKIGAAGFTVGIALKISGFYLFGLLGIALGASLHYALTAAALYFFLEKRHRNTEASD